ncbi:CBO0543 family protein [Halalkalibacter flavus]|uniref:CBO0543 family protein n=1 Tax=Halalkalibacter flavus TaxID=3090668 RepID=UPI002FC7784B
MLKSRSVLKDEIILKLIWLVTIGLLFKYIPKNKLRHGILAFLYKQVVTWVFGLLVVEKGLIKYPVRFFKKANKSSFSFEYFLYPSFSAIFNLNYPENKNRFIKFIYYIFHAGIITIIEVLAERYTNIIKYVKWKWYWSFITLGITYYSSRLFYRWFFKEEF